MEKKKITEGMTGRQKAAWFWYYYKWFVILAVGLGLFAVWGAVSVHREYNKEYIANVQFVNCETYTVDQSDYFDRFLNEYGYEEDTLIGVDSTVEVNLDGGGQSSASGLQVLAAMFLTGEMDLFISDEPLFALECEKNAFADLRTVLTESQLETYASSLYYAENPETGEQVPCGLYLADTAVCRTEQFYRAEDSPVIGVSSQSQAAEEDVVRLLEYFMK